MCKASQRNCSKSEPSLAYIALCILVAAGQAMEPGGGVSHFDGTEAKSGERSAGRCNHASPNQVPCQECPSRLDGGAQEGHHAHHELSRQ